MKAMMKNDTCYSTLNGGHNPFNFDFVERDHREIDKAREALDFEILKVPSYDRDPETGDMREVPHHFHLLKDTDRSFIPCTSVGEQFTPMQHRDVFDYIVNKVMPEYPNMELETCGTLYGGSTGLMTFKVGDLFHISGDKSPSEMRLFVSNPCNGTGSLIMGFTTVRLFCRNQIAIAKRTAGRDGYKIRHTKTVEEVVGRSVKEIAEQVKAAKMLKDRCEFLAGIPVTRKQLDECLDRIYPFGKLEEGMPAYTRLTNMRNEVIEQFEAGHTAQTTEGKTGWTLFNSFTYPVFNPEKIGDRTDAADIDYKGMAGEKTQRVNQMLDLVQEVVAA